MVHLAIANFTGSLRLLTGFGWPMIYGVASFSSRRTGAPLGRIALHDDHAVEVVGLLPPLAYFVVVWWKGSLSLVDSVVLIGTYALYLVVLLRLPPRPETTEEDEEIPAVSRWALSFAGWKRWLAVGGLFLAGGAIILARRRAVPRVDDGDRDDARIVAVRLHPVGRPVHLRVSRETLGVRLGAARHPRARGAAQHGVVEHQPVGRPVGPARDHLLRQPRRHVGAPVRRVPETRDPADDPPGLPGMAVPRVDELRGLRGGGPLRALGRPVREAVPAARHGLGVHGVDRGGARAARRSARSGSGPSGPWRARGRSGDDGLEAFAADRRARPVVHDRGGQEGEGSRRDRRGRRGPLDRRARLSDARLRRAGRRARDRGGPHEVHRRGGGGGAARRHRREVRPGAARRGLARERDRDGRGQAGGLQRLPGGLRRRRRRRPLLAVLGFLSRDDPAHRRRAGVRADRHREGVAAHGRRARAPRSAQRARRRPQFAEQSDGRRRVRGGARAHRRLVRGAGRVAGLRRDVRPFPLRRPPPRLRGGVCARDTTGSRSRERRRRPGP